MKKKYLIITILVIIVILSACSVSVDKPEESVENTEVDTNYEEIVEKVLKEEHEHKWVFVEYDEKHPHSAIYKCECGATLYKADETADYKMTIIGPSKVHPHYMVEECSICHQQFVNENLPTKITWLLDGYQKEHPHYAIIKCSQCDYSYIEYNTKAEDRGVCKMVSTESQKEHPHYLIFECTFEGCDYSFVDKNITADFELNTDETNYGIAHPHYLYATCSYDGCEHQEVTSETADWTWDDGVCSICGVSRDYKYKKTDSSIIVTGLIDDNYEGELKIPMEIIHYPVEIIGDSSFEGNERITMIGFPETVAIIENNAFRGCSNIQIEDLDLNVLFIGENAFRDCNHLDMLTLGVGIEEIGNNAFAGCENLERIRILAPVAPRLGNQVFENTSIDFRIEVPYDAIGYDGVEWQEYLIEYIDY